MSLLPPANRVCPLSLQLGRPSIVQLVSEKKKKKKERKRREGEREVHTWAGAVVSISSCFRFKGEMVLYPGWFTGLFESSCSLRLLYPYGSGCIRVIS